MPRCPLIVVLLLAACGLPEAEYEQSKLDAQCALLYSCTAESDLEYLPYEDEADCADPDGVEFADEADDGCSYDGKLAEACLVEWQETSCAQWSAGQTPLCNPWSCE